MKLGTKSHRYTYTSKEENKSKKMSFEKKTALQSISSILILACSLYVCYSDNPKLEFFKNYIRSSLNISTDISEAKAFAKDIYQKSGIEKIYKEKNDDENLEQTNEAKIPVENEVFEDTQEDKTVIEYPQEDVKISNENVMPAFANPTQGEITSAFGTRIHPITGAQNTHTGIDIAGILDQTVISAAEGTVIKCAEDNNNGKYIIIKHTGGYTSAYAHLNKICVTEGEWVDNNTKIGQMGSSGVSTGVHLHFEIKKDNERLNPEDFVKYKHRG